MSYICIILIVLNRAMKKKLAKKLIAHYKESIRLISVKGSDVSKILRKRSVNMGVCFCAIDVFKVDIYKDAWVSSKVKKVHCGYWCPQPGTVSIRDSFYKESVIKLLKKRVKILKTFKNKS